MKIERNSKDVVLSFVKALNEENFDTAKSFLNDQFTFKGALGTRNGAGEYMKDMEKMKLKYNINKVFVDGDSVCLIYDIDMSGKTIVTCGLYHLENGKISSLRVIFDPRPILEVSDL